MNEKQTQSQCEREQISAAGLTSGVQQPSRGRGGGAVMNTESQSHVTLSASSKCLTDTDKG